jgi:hypothetical protein
MPPKKDKNKIVEDKTFGLKNKNKSAKVSRYVEQVKNQAKQAGQNRKDLVTMISCGTRCVEMLAQRKTVIYPVI